MTKAKRDDMKTTAIAPWFGGKRNLATRIVDLLGGHRMYWEPFCGSMAVLLAKPECKMETVCDLHGDLANLALVIRDDKLGPRLYRKLRRTLINEAVFRESANAILRYDPPNADDVPNVERAYHYFVTAWLGRNGVAGTANCNYSFCARYTGNGGHAATRWRSAIGSIPAWRGRLRNVTILCRDAFGVIDKIQDAPGTAIYCDPPYFVKGAKYMHDFSGDAHERLAAALTRFHKARVVVSYYDDARLTELYPGWFRVAIEVSRATANQGRRGASDKRAVEVLLVNDRAGWTSMPLFA